MTLCVIGVGSAHGDDAAGLRVIDALERTGVPGGIALLRCAHPLELLDAMSGARAAIVIDAARAGAAPGTLRALPWESLVREPAVSTHGLGVAQALALAQALDRMPPHVEIIAIEAADEVPGEGLSAPVAAAVAWLAGDLGARLATHACAQEAR
jgi:hydrogenase maturation protease